MPRATFFLYRARMALGELTPHNVKQLALICNSIFPVSYSDKFFKTAVAAGELSKIIYCDDILVGGVCCRLDKIPDSKNNKLYIMILGVLAPYRRMGLGKLMVEHVLKLAEDDKTVTAISLHVQTNNEDAVAFYKNFGFEIVETVQGYYKKPTPMDAYVLEKKVREA
ncbi:uncharacterized protein MONBRDRAFT_13971 [Monosiga brevicollis MX1]|uniref:N-acetyltransferase domain-containing protein n=1 Tax=Monosiga brevicollis TaxID=81824 RepID=A9UP90_MONBE|nr:uncharacterized protein MONBRDRAFT_13971 [Monosiga brevicollis MX1]EDQ92832.1 predicted protein [Monosiga brevicollis MX1]|eukprot:XP_001742594.1 hypothetical protein [Monosiga brevicollis MX1]